MCMFEGQWVRGTHQTCFRRKLFGGKSSSSSLFRMYCVYAGAHLLHPEAQTSRFASHHHFTTFLIDVLCSDARGGTQPFVALNG